MADREFALAWAKIIRQRFVSAKRDIENEILVVQTELFNMAGEDGKQNVNDIQPSLLLLTRIEYLRLIPILFDSDIIREPNFLDPEYPVKLLEKRGVMLMQAVTTPLKGDRKPILLIIADPQFKEDDELGDYVLDKNFLSQKLYHEAFHLSDRTEAFPLDNGAVAIHSGYENLVMDPGNRDRVFRNETWPGRAMEEGMAVLFQSRFGVSYKNNPHLPKEYKDAAGFVAKMIEKIGLRKMINLRLNHDYEEISRVFVDVFSDLRTRYEIEAIDRKIRYFDAE